MALRKSDLRALLRNEDATVEEKISEILNLLHEEVDGVKDERDELKKQVAEVQEMLEKAEKNAGKGDEWKTKYEEVSSEFEAYKKTQEEAAVKAAKETAFRKLLTEAGVVERSIDSILAVTPLDFELAEDGSVVDAETVSASIKDKWSGFIAQEHTSGARTQTPPANSGEKLTKEKIAAITDTAKRQKAIAENLDLYGF